MRLSAFPAEILEFSDSIQISMYVYTEVIEVVDLARWAVAVFPSREPRVICSENTFLWLFCLVYYDIICLCFLQLNYRLTDLSRKI